MSLNPDEVISFELDDRERKVLVCAMADWGGPAYCTEEMARAIGFEGVDDLLVQAERLGDRLRAREPLSRLDWLRTLLATEVCFVSNIVGSGLDWPITSQVSDEETIQVLRRIQRRLTPEVFGLVGVNLGTREFSGVWNEETGDWS